MISATFHIIIFLHSVFENLVLVFYSIYFDQSNQGSLFIEMDFKTKPGAYFAQHIFSS